MPHRRPIRRHNPPSSWRRAAWLGVLAMGLVGRTCGVAMGQIQLPESDDLEGIVISAPRGRVWKQGRHEVWILDGGCRAAQGTSRAIGQRAVLWIEREPIGRRQPSLVTAYLEGDVEVTAGDNGGSTRLQDRAYLQRFRTVAPIQVMVDQVSGPPVEEPAIYQRAVRKRDEPLGGGVVRQAQFNASEPPETILDDEPPGERRVQVFPRSDLPLRYLWREDPNGDLWVATFTSGVNLVVDGLAGALPKGFEDVELIDVSTDRLVLWTVGIDQPDLSGNTSQANDTPLEIYMEGNIVFREGDRIIHADRMYYDVTRRVGVILDAEVLTPVPDYNGLLRMRAKALRQTGQDRFVADDVFVTSSRLGWPGYRMQITQAEFEDTQTPRVNRFTGQAAFDPETGQPLREHRQRIAGRHGAIYLRDIPVFYWPWVAVDMRDPTFYIRRVRLKNDTVFGSQILTDWHLYQILGIRQPPEGTDWDLSLDWLEKRGFGHGTNFTYNRPGLFDLPGRAVGMIDFWGIQDKGLDNVGRGRQSLEPEKSYRFRGLWKHRHVLSEGLILSAEAGYVSDRSFLQNYYEHEWQTLKDQNTRIELKRTWENHVWSVSAGKRINSFLTETEWLPRVDLFSVGQSILADRLTWHQHTSVGFARFRTASAPANPADFPFEHVAWETDAAGDPLGVRGERAVTRHEVDLPVALGPVNVVPYALGELAHWGSDREGDDRQRAYGQVGIRASLPAWRVYPNVDSDLWNVHGLAHKVVFDAEFSVTDSTVDMEDLPLYDSLDDDSVEAFRRRLAVNTFASPVVPDRFEERRYALRHGMAGLVTAPSAEIADDLTVCRVGMRHRWQTKRGRPGERRIIDWITFDTHASIFPKADRDNFGQTLGLLDYQFQWHVGDRLTVLSDGMADLFGDGLRTVSIGGYLGRPARGSVYVGLRHFDGPFSMSVLSGSLDYRMSEKWVTQVGLSYDLAGEGNLGHRVTLTRIGESFLVSVGFSYDPSRDNVGAQLTIEPRFLPETRLGNVAGAIIPPAGAYGLE